MKSVISSNIDSFIILEYFAILEKALNGNDDFIDRAGAVGMARADMYICLKGRKYFFECKIQNKMTLTQSINQLIGYEYLICH